MTAVETPKRKTSSESPSKVTQEMIAVLGDAAHQAITLILVWFA